MGCDIHIWAERKTDSGWEAYGEIFDNPYYQPEKEAYIDSDGYNWNAVFTDQPYRGRNYSLFALLADVRNYDGNTPLAPPRGIPEDASEYFITKSNEYGIDGHSHSYFTLEELMSYDWDTKHQYEGLVTSTEYAIAKKNNFTKSPNWYCGGTSAPIISNEEMDEKIATGEEEGYYTSVKWTESAADALGTNWTGTLAKLKELSVEAGGYENIRIVFFFDN